MATGTIQTILQKHSGVLLEDWMKAQLSSDTLRSDLMKESELRDQSTQFISVFRGAAAGGTTDIRGAEWAPVRELLAQITRSRTLQGFTPAETATCVLSLKQALFGHIRRQHNDTATTADDYWDETILLD